MQTKLERSGVMARQLGLSEKICESIGFYNWVETWKKLTKEPIEQTARKLGLSEESYKSADITNWQEKFEAAGTHILNEYYQVNSIGRPNQSKLPAIIPEAKVLVVSMKQDYSGYNVLVQERSGEGQSECKIGVPGGASKILGYTPEGASKENVILEHPILTAYRKWKEEFGCELVDELDLSTVVITKTINVCYEAVVSWEYAQYIEEMCGAESGKVKIIPVNDLPKYKWSSDVAEAFGILVNRYGEKN